MSTLPPVPSESAPPADWAALLEADGMDALSVAIVSRNGDGAGLALAWKPGHDAAVRVSPGIVGAIDWSRIATLATGEPIVLGADMAAMKLAGDDAAWAALLCDPRTVAPTSLEQQARSLRPFVASALERERLRQSVATLRQGERVQRALYEITEMASSGLDMPTMLGGLHRIVGRLMEAENFFIALYDAGSDSIRFIYFADTADDEWQDPDAVDPMSQIEGSLTWHLIRGAKPLMGPTSLLYRELQGPLAVIGPGAADWLGVPIMVGGAVRAALVVQSYAHGGVYTAVERDLLAYVGTHIVTAIDRKHAFEQLGQQARELERQIDVRMQVERRLQHEVLHDALTGLPNRAYLRDHLARAMATQARDACERFAVLFLDLDRFKVINDSVGHLVGDELLKAVAGRFAACLRPPDIVARLGGDEFAILMHGVDGSDAPARLAQRLIDALREPIRIDDKELFTGVSVGIALSSPSHTAAEELLRDADIAMYRVKERGRGGFELFDEHLHHQAMELLALEGDLRLALPRGELVPYFQPVVRLADGAVIGYEALMRWNHPTRGLLAPGAFLRVAEASGILEALDWQLYDAVCRTVPTLLRDGQYVHINVAPRHFLGGDLDVRLLALLARHRVRPQQVRIEITEGALIDNPERVGGCIDRLREAGVFTALDDFGTGYSSMSYLHRFRFHTIKLDRSFITGLAPGVASVAASVVRAVVDLSHALGLEVIAEGIETTAERDAVAVLGCGAGQGYLFARPAPAASISGTSSRDARHC
jgi:diguanylate cyclase (GGDEF)-like protein